MIAIIQNKPGIGDMCLYLPMIHAISKFESKKLYLFTKSSSKAKEILKYDPFFKQIIYIDTEIKKKDIFSQYNFFKNFNFDKVFIFGYGIRYPFLFKLLKSKKIYYYGMFKKKTNIVFDAKNLLDKSIGKKNYSLKCKLYLKNDKSKNIYKCVIGIGGSGSTKKWSIKNYQYLIDALKKKGFKDFVIAGGVNEIEDFKYLSSVLNDTNLISLCDKNIEQCIQEISRAKTYVGNDTGFMHLSGLCGLETYGLFGDTPTNYASYNPIIKTIIPEGYKNIGHNDKAINKISVNRVLGILNLN